MTGVESLEEALLTGRTRIALIRQEVQRKTSLSRRKSLLPLYLSLKDMVICKAADVRLLQQRQHKQIMCEEKSRALI